MTDLQEILDDLAATAYCAGQDWSKTNPTTDKVDLASGEALTAIQSLIEAALPDGCEYCDYKGYTETGGMAMEDDLVEKEPCEYCSDILAEIRNNLKGLGLL